MKENIVRGQNSVIRTAYNTLAETTDEIDVSCQKIYAMGAGRPDITGEIAKMYNRVVERQKELVRLLEITIPEVTKLLSEQGLEHWLNTEENDAAVAAAQGRQ